MFHLFRHHSPTQSQYTPMEDHGVQFELLVVDIVDIDHGLQGEMIFLQN